MTCSLRSSTLVGLVGSLVAVGSGTGSAQELTYRDLGEVRSSAAPAQPLIPAAALTAPSTASRGTLAMTAPSAATDVIPLALARGSEAARIYERNRQRVGLLSELFQRVRNGMRESEQAEQRAREEAAAEAREAAARERAEADLMAREQAETARREAEARSRLASLEAARTAPPSPPAPAVRAPATRTASTELPSRPAPVPEARIVDRTSPAATGSQVPGEVVVQKGDSLISIARRAYGDHEGWRQIASANGLPESAVLRVGQKLKVPAYERQARPVSWRKAQAARADDEPVLDYVKYEYRLYNIRQGDTLGAIAARFYGNAQATSLIERYNSRTLVRGLKAGDKLLIPVERSAEHEARYRQSREGIFD